MGLTGTIKQIFDILLILCYGRDLPCEGRDQIVANRLNENRIDTRQIRIYILHLENWRQVTHHAPQLSYFGSTGVTTGGSTGKPSS